MLYVNFYNGAKWLQPAEGSPHWAYDWYVRENFELSFEDFKVFLQNQKTDVFAHKELARLWNFTILKEDAPREPKNGLVKRNNKDAYAGVSALVLDFDGGVTIEDFIAQSEGMSYALHSTYSHRSARKGGADCFRAIVELSEPIPWELLQNADHTHGSILPALWELWPGADRSCFEPARAHYIPSLPEEGWPYTCHVSAGEPLNWRELQLTPPIPRRVYAPVVTTKGGSGALLKHTLDLVSLFEDRGWVKRSSGTTKTVTCPNEYGHTQKDDATRLIDMSGTWHFKCHHSHCGGTAWVRGWLFDNLTEEELRPYCETKIEGVRFVPKLPDGADIDEPTDMSTEREQVQPQKRTYNATMSMHDRIGVLKQALLHKHVVIRTSEGFGKSTIIVRELLTAGKEVLFCTASNAQADAKMKDFELYSPQRAWSLAGLMQYEAGFKPVHEVADHAWDEAPIDEEATLELITEKLKVTPDEASELLLNWQEMAKASRRVHAKLVVTTFATGSSMKRIQGHLGRVIVVDDPSTGDLQTDIWGHEDGAFKVVRSRPINDVVFGTVSGGFDPVIWTTTEKLVADTVKFQHPDAHIIEVNESLKTEDVLMIPTPLTRKRLKFVLPGIAKVARKRTKHEFEVIGNGLQTDVNLVSSKGRNDLNFDQLIIISYPHPLEVMAVTSSMGLDEHERKRVLRQMVVDITNQILGRTQGYRAKGSKVLLLVDPHLEITLRANSRYELPSLERYQLRGRLAGYPLVWSTEMPNWWSCIRMCLQTWQEYVVIFGERAIWLDRSEDSPERQREVKRLLSEPIEDMAVHWKLKHELVEGEGRRNYSIAVHELIDERTAYVTRLAVERKAKVAKVNGTKVGKKIYADPNGKRRYFEPGTEPEGWSLVAKPRADGSVRGKYKNSQK